MSIFGSDYGYEDDLYVISGDLDMDGENNTSKIQQTQIMLLIKGIWTSASNTKQKPRARLSTRKTGLGPQYFNTDRSKAVLLLWFLTVTCSCCPCLYFGSALC